MSIILPPLVAGLVGGICSWLAYWTGFRDARANPYRRMPRWLERANAAAIDEGERAAGLKYLSEIRDA